MDKHIREPEDSTEVKGELRIILRKCLFLGKICNNREPGKE